jgi:hypothetical protein
LEKLVPEVKESTRLRDQLDLVVGEAPARRGSSMRWRRRERGGQGGKTGSESSSPRCPLFIWTDRGTGLSGLSLDRIFRPSNNLDQKWPR